jgi:hypothetical protein
MTTDHRAEAAERLRACDYQRQQGDLKGARLEAATAQVHATLARDEEQATRHADMQEALHSLRRRFGDTRSLVAVHIAEGLASRDKDRWKAAIDLSKALDEAHCNVDDLVDGRLEDDGWDPRSAYKTPASAVRADDPWAPAPDIAADIPEPVRRVIVERLAAMLLHPENGEVNEQARRIAFALKDAGADLTDAVKTHITDSTLGRDPSEPPF